MPRAVPMGEAYQALIRAITHPPNPDFEPTEDEAAEMIETFVHEAKSLIMADMYRQGAGGQYDMGMKRALFLIDKMMEDHRSA